ncbi:unnamed protein product [Rotaria sordida]|uniref:Uncharacterized protein n=1 Tax=Rotaria sordida TaxID=392033 RepID=A0A814GIA7_9BILA|nr:unnamed protein product [Rotaria sordida]CAF1258956.1 unnamed protein product [Rotaria sordida]CAF3823903.1 unnamed protein product [Rotaria sordida]CAF4002928.1 unnamed protein product [Rotaria sordida]
MWLGLFILFYSFIFNDGKHFNGGTIRWAPVDPYDNSSSLDITITQSYSWTYPYIKCANNVPISTSGFTGANTNLICVVDCSTNGGYSSAPIDILTNCTSASSSLNMMTSERSKNITLSAGAHFYLAYRGNAWLPLNDPAQTGLEWSIVTYIDLRKRSDGFINTPPVATIVSPQYAIVNRTIQINIPVSDANVGDDVRCRWSKYTSGYRRRKRSDNEEHVKHPSRAHPQRQQPHPQQPLSQQQRPHRRHQQLPRHRRHQQLPPRRRHQQLPRHRRHQQLPRHRPPHHSHKNPTSNRPMISLWCLD